MEKLAMLENLEFRLGSLGIPYQRGTGADFTIRTEFLDASWGAGHKKIEYEAAAFLNESERILYFWELTKETGSGLSFSGETESSFQTGTTLFRKIKGVGYGPDGKAYEYSLDLGAITKAFKEAAQQYGWKFKVVLKKEKATYPPGYAPFGNAPPQRQTAEALNPGIPSAISPISNSESGAPPHATSPNPEASLRDRQPDMPQPLLSRQADFRQSFSEKGRPYDNHSNDNQPYDNPQAPFYARGKKKTPGKTGVFYWLFLIILTLLDILLFIGGSGFPFLICAGAIPVLLFGFRNCLAKGFLRPVLCFVGAFIITVIFFAFIGNDTAGKTKPAGVHTTSHAPADAVSPPGLNTAVSLSQSNGAVRVTLPNWVLPTGEKLTIAEDPNPPAAPDDPGVVFQAYDIHLPSGSNMEGIAAIDLPFDKKMIPQGAAPEEAVGAGYYDPGARAWKPMPCAVNAEAGTVTIYTDHFSKFAAVILKDGRKKLGEILPRFDDLPIHFYSQDDLEKIVAESAAGAAESPTAVEKGWNQFNKLYNLTGAGSTVLEATVGAETLNHVNELMNEAGLGFALAQLAFDLSKDDRNAAVLNFAKNGAFYSVSKWGADALGLATAGVTFIDLAVNEFGEGALEKNLQKWEGAYRRYYDTETGVRRSAEDWYHICVKLYKASKNGKDFKAKLDAEVTAYCQKFWNDPEGYAHVAASTSGIRGFGAGGEDAAGRDRISANYKIFIKQNTIKTALNLMIQKLWFYEMQKAEEDFNKLKAEMNQVYSVMAQLDNHTAVKNLQACTVRFINLQGEVVHSQSLDSEGRAVIQMTLFGFLKAGGPLKIEVSVPAQEKTPAFKTQLTYQLQDVNTMVRIPYTPGKETKEPETPKREPVRTTGVPQVEIKNTGFFGSWKFKYTVTDTVLPDDDRAEMMDELADQFSIVADEQGKPAFTISINGCQMYTNGNNIKYGFRSSRQVRSAQFGYSLGNRWFFEGKIDGAGKTMSGEFQAINRDNQYFLKGNWEAHKFR